MKTMVGRMVLVGAALLLGSVSTVSAEAPQLPLFDDGYVVINLNNEVSYQSGNKPSKVSYSPAMRMRVFGADTGDALRVRWLKGKKKLFEKRCPLTVRNGEGQLGLADRCWTRDAGMNTHGTLAVEVYFVDDSEESETLIRKMSVPVGRFWKVDRILKGKAIHSPRFQAVGSDLMGLAYAWTAAPDDITPFGDVSFYFWSTLANDSSNYRDPSWRCKLDGKAVPEMNVDGHQVIESIADIKAQDDQMQGKKRVSTWYGWRLMWIKPKLVWGAERNPTAPDTVSSSRYNISKHPGSYVCRLRNEGKSVREFGFKVLEDGTLAPHGAQAEGGLTLRPGATFVDMTIVPNGAESSFDAKAAKKSVAFGRPWTGSPDVKAHLKAFPKSFGKATPPKPRGAR